MFELMKQAQLLISEIIQKNLTTREDQSWSITSINYSASTIIVHIEVRTRDLNGKDCVTLSILDKNVHITKNGGGYRRGRLNSANHIIWDM